MWASEAVVGVFAQHSPQVRFSENHYSVEAFAVGRSDPSLRESVGVGSAYWGMDDIWICWEAKIVSKVSVNLESLSCIRKCMRGERVE